MLFLETTNQIASEIMNIDTKWIEKNSSFNKVRKNRGRVSIKDYVFEIIKGGYNK